MSESLDPNLFTSTGKRKYIPKIIINLGRCRYPVVRSSAEFLGFVVDFDDEDLASTLTKTIKQPQRGGTGSTTTSSSTGISSLAQSRNSSQTHPHEPVFRMIESRRAHIMWSDVTVTTQQLSSCAVWQRLNHFPGISQTVSRKVPLGQTMMRAWKIAPEYFADIVPLSFSLKRDAPVLRQYFEEIEFSGKMTKRKKKNKKKVVVVVNCQNDNHDNDTGTKKVITAKDEVHPLATISASNPFRDPRHRVFIFKPNSGCMGHDIRLTCKPLTMMQKLLSGNINATRHLKEDEDFVVQVYIDRPMLIEKRKFDLRVYVLLMGVTPDLRILIHREGLVRICASEYLAPKASNVRKSTMHLTNYAVNKRTLSTPKKKVNKNNDSTSEDDEEEEDETEDVELENDQIGNSKKNGSDQEDDCHDDDEGGIDGIKRDFDFFNKFLDSQQQQSQNSNKEEKYSTTVWRRIDRAVVMTLLAAHPELDRTYRQASSSNQVLLKRIAVQYLKDQKLQKEQQEKEKEKEKQKTQEKDEDDEDDDEQDDGEDPADDEQQDEQQQQNQISDELFIENCCIGRNCFELLGFDLLLTEDGQPCVMEVNHGPSLETGADIDKRIKTKVLQDTFNHVSLLLPNNTKKANLLGRRYLQRIVKRAGKNPMIDLQLGAEKDSGYRVAYPLVAPFENEKMEILANEYANARSAIYNSLPSGASSSPIVQTPTAGTVLQRKSSFSLSGGKNEKSLLLPRQNSRTSSSSVNNNKVAMQSFNQANTSGVVLFGRRSVSNNNKQTQQQNGNNNNNKCNVLPRWQ